MGKTPSVNQSTLLKYDKIRLKEPNKAFGIVFLRSLITCISIDILDLFICVAYYLSLF